MGKQQNNGESISLNDIKVLMDKLDKLDKRMDKRMDKLDKRMESLEDEVKGVKCQISELEGQMTEVQDNYGDIQSQMLQNREDSLMNAWVQSDLRDTGYFGIRPSGRRASGASVGEKRRDYPRARPKTF